MSTVGSALVAGSDGVSEEADIAPVVTGDEEVAVGASVDSVDVRAVSASGEDSLNVPSELDVLRSELHFHGVGSTTGVLSQVTVFGNVPEEKLVGSAGGSDPFAVARPIEGLDGGRVLGTGSAETPRSGVIDTDLLVVRSSSEVLATGGDLENLKPLFGLLKLDAGTVGFVNVNDTIVSSNDSLFVRSDSNGTSLLGRESLGKGRSSSSLGLDFAGRNVPLLHALAGLMVPSDDLVVISGGDDAVGVHVSKTPDLTVVVRFHDGVLLLGFDNASLDASVFSSDDEGAIFMVDSADHGAEADGLLAVKGFAGVIPAFDAAVFTSSEEHIVLDAHGGDEPSLVGFDDTVKSVVLPDEDASVGASSVEGTVGIRSADEVSGG